MYVAFIAVTFHSVVVVISIAQSVSVEFASPSLDNLVLVDVEEKCHGWAAGLGSTLSVAVITPAQHAASPPPR